MRWLVKEGKLFLPRKSARGRWWIASLPTHLPTLAIHQWPLDAVTCDLSISADVRCIDDVIAIEGHASNRRGGLEEDWHPLLGGYWEPLSAPVVEHPAMDSQCLPARDRPAAAEAPVRTEGPVYTCRYKCCTSTVSYRNQENPFLP